MGVLGKLAGGVGGGAIGGLTGYAGAVEVPRYVPRKVSC